MSEQEQWEAYRRCADSLLARIEKLEKEVRELERKAEQLATENQRLKSGWGGPAST